MSFPFQWVKCRCCGRVYMTWYYTYGPLCRRCKRAATGNKT